MPSTTSSEVSIDLASSTVITPSLPTFSIASAMMLPIVSALLAEIVPTCAIILPLPGVPLRGSASRLTRPRIDCRDSSAYVIDFAIFSPSVCSWCSACVMKRRLSDHRQDFVLAEDQHFLAVDLDVRAGVLAEEDLVA